MISGLLLAINSYRLNRSVEITEMLNDTFWFVWVATWPTFIVQFLTFASAVIVDCRPKPLFPKVLAAVNILVSIIPIPGNVSAHCFKTGPLAWNGAMSFWVPGVSWMLLVASEFVCLIRSISTEAAYNKENGFSNPDSVGNGSSNELGKGGDATVNVQA